MKTAYLKAAMFAAFAGLFPDANAQQPVSKAAGSNLSLTVDLTQVSYPVEKLFFTYYNTTTKFRYTDSVTIGSQKVVSFKTSVAEPILAQLRVVPSAKDAQNTGGTRSYYSRDNYTLYIEPGKLTAVTKDSLGNTHVTGSASHKDYLALQAKAAVYEDQFEKLYTEYGAARKSKDIQQETAIRKQIDSLENQLNEKVYKEFVRTHGKRSAVALYALAQYTGYSIDPVKAQPVYDLLGPTVKELPAGKAFAKRIEIARHLQIGQPAFPFTQNDTLDKPVSLASFKGKYVLIDFWASWCGPCRAENPNVLAAFNKYKDKGFTVLGVSLDRPGQKERWLKAIHDDGLTWTHVSDLKFWDNEVAKLYDIKAIPQNYLVDKEGKIIARDIRGEQLLATLETLVK